MEEALGVLELASRRRPWLPPPPPPPPPLRVPSGGLEEGEKIRPPALQIN